MEGPTRRRFLAGAAVTLWPAALRAAGKRERLHFDVVSDTHLGRKDSTTPAAHWERAAEELAKTPGKLVLHLGDVVDGGRAAQYPIYLETRKKIGKPVHEIPGNHDPAELFQKHIRKDIDTAVNHQWLRFLLINNSHTDSHLGFITDAQNAWIETQCADAVKQQQHLILCLHVPVHANRHPDRGWFVKPADGQTAFYETMLRYQGRIIGLFHGHFHNGIRGWDDHPPLQEILFPSLLYNLDRGLKAKGAPGYNLPEFRPGYTQVTIGPHSMHLQYKPLGEDASVQRDCPLVD